MANPELILIDFNKSSDMDGWYVVNDGVMGGLSKGSFTLNKEGHAVFSGQVSLENNGGFSSVRANYKDIAVSPFTKVSLRLRGDGKQYQLRIKSNRYDRHSYVAYFDTSGEWETIHVDLRAMYPTFRGRRLNMPNYPGNQLEELAILIGNKKEEQFQLELDKIFLQ